MIKTLPVVLAGFFATLSTALPAQIPANYYDTVDTTNAATLRASLNDVISVGTTVIPFDNGPGNSGTDESFKALRTVNRSGGDPNLVKLFYSQDLRPGYPNNGNVDGDPATGGWSREHAFPQSFYDLDGPGGNVAVDPPRSDLHALWPADADINNRRSNSIYDLVPAPTFTDVFGNVSDSNNFEPRDISKGDAARAVFYMDLRYEGENGEPNLTIDAASGGTSGLTMAKLSTLLQWHNQDPPDAFEVYRNRRVYELQGNANPFVDHPEWVNTIYGIPPAAVSNGGRLTVTPVSAAPGSIQQDAWDVPMLALNLSTTGAEYDVGEIDLTNTGTLPDDAITMVRLFEDRDNSHTVTASDNLLDEGTFTGGVLTLTPAAPYRINNGSSGNLLVVVELARQAPLSASMRVRLDAIRHSARGGVDIDPTFPAFNSNPSLVVPGGINIVAISASNLNGASYEYLVLANHARVPVDIGGWQLRNKSATGTNTSTLDFDPGTTIGAGDHYIIATDEYGGLSNIEGVEGDMQVDVLLGGISDGGRRSIALFTGSGEFARKVDGFSIAGGADDDGGFNEGTPFSGSFSSTASKRGIYKRKRPGGDTGPYIDTDDNSNDIELFAFSTTENVPKPPPSDNDISPAPAVGDSWGFY